MIWSLKIKLLFGAYAKDDWEGEIEIKAESTLEELHFAIIQAIGFDNDHLYEFFVARTDRSRDRLRFDDENEEIYSRTIESVFPLEKGRKLFYLFDYGDNWLFQVQKSRKKPHTANPDVNYPRLVSSVGDRPEQYPVMEW